MSAENKPLARMVLAEASPWQEIDPPATLVEQVISDEVIPNDLADNSPVQ